ncbi:zinc-ribbon domain-containing protein [bacterium]|nr:zinc-ribbon domain-containing protein [bacterium]
MNIYCPNCNFKYEIDDTKIPDGGVDVKCSSCQSIFSITPKTALYIKNSDQVIYTASSPDEIIDWIKERRVLREFEFSRDKTNWIKLEEIPQYKELFDKITLSVPTQKPQIPEEEKFTFTQSQKFTPNPSNSVASTQKLNQIKYNDYDDSKIESISLHSLPKRKKGIWYFLIFLIIVAAVAFFKKDLILEYFNKLKNSSTITATEDLYSEGVNKFKKYDPPALKDAITNFNKYIKDNPKHIYSIAYRALAVEFQLFFLYYEIDFNKNLRKLIEKIGDNDRVSIQDIDKNIELYTKEFESLKKEMQPYALMGTALDPKQFYVIVSMAMYSFYMENEGDFNKYRKEAESLKPDDEFVSFLDILNKTRSDENLIESLKDLSKRYPSFIPFKYLLAQYYFMEGKYEAASVRMESIIPFQKNHSLAVSQIDILEFLMKNEKLLENKADDKEIKNTTNENKEDTNTTKTDQENKVEKETPKETNEKKVEVELSFEQLMASADKAFERGQSKTAYNNYKKALQKKQSAKAASQMGWILYDWGNLDSSASYFKQAISIDPDYSDAYLGAGEAYFANEEKENAKKYFQLFLQKNPNSPEANIAKDRLKKL